ncbi:MAG: protein YgfX [Shewanella sp.]
MAEPHLSFRLTSSFDQRLALVVLACVCLSSFLAWPSIDNFIYLSIKYCAVGLTLVFFFYQFWQLKYWYCRCSFSRDGRGLIAFRNRRRHTSVNDTATEKFTLVLSPLVTPLVVFFYIHTEDINVGHRRLVIIWADMLDDTSYRHLCRLLLSD